MKWKEPIGIALIAIFYIWGACVLILTLFAVGTPKDDIGISIRIGLPLVSENAARIGLSVLSLVLAFGLIKLSKWGFWLFEIYNIYMFFISLNLYFAKFDQLFFGNMISALFFFLYIYWKRQYFLKPKI